MCDTCGCGDPDIIPIEVQKNVLAQNDRVAGHNREHLQRDGISAINIMGSPGSGKTALLEATARQLGDAAQLVAISADLATDNDAQRLNAAGIRSYSITTGTACHLDAKMVHDRLHHLDLHGCRFLFIENVGNLVCPAIYDLGQAANVVTLAVTEGEDKPLKYPVMFHKADLVVISKVDLLPHLKSIDVGRIRAAIQRVAPGAKVIEVSSETGTGLQEWSAWLTGLAASTNRSGAARDAGVTV